MSENWNLELTRAQVSERSFLSAVYGWMSAGLALTALVAYWASLTPGLIVALAQNPMLLLLLMVVQIGIVFWLSAFTMKLNIGVATFGFGLYAVLNGILLSGIFLVYTATSVATTFFVTAGTFAAMCVYGFTTRRDLTSIGNLCFMALLGMILASVVNIFLRNSGMDLALSYLGVAVFVGLTAYDTQRLKQIHEQGFEGASVLQKMALLGALRLYLDFLNLFLSLLRIMGRRRD